MVGDEPFAERVPVEIPEESEVVGVDRREAGRWSGASLAGEAPGRREITEEAKGPHTRSSRKGIVWRGSASCRSRQDWSRRASDRWAAAARREAKEWGPRRGSNCRSRGRPSIRSRRMTNPRCSRNQGACRRTRGAPREGTRRRPCLAPAKRPALRRPPARMRPRTSRSGKRVSLRRSRLCLRSSHAPCMEGPSSSHSPCCSSELPLVRGPLVGFSPAGLERSDGPARAPVLRFCPWVRRSWPHTRTCLPCPCTTRGSSWEVSFTRTRALPCPTPVRPRVLVKSWGPRSVVARTVPEDG
jgi:hypothetical protein